MLKQILAGTAAVAAMALVTPAMAQDAEQGVDVEITVAAFVEIVMDENATTITNEIDGLGDFGGAWVPFEVIANADYSLYAEPDQTVQLIDNPRLEAEGVPDILFGSAACQSGDCMSSGDSEIAYFINLGNAAQSWIAGLPMVINVPPRTVTGDGTNPTLYVQGGLGTTLYHIKATGHVTDTPSGNPAAPGFYTGTASIVANLNN